MAKTLIVSNRLQAQGKCRMAILPDDFNIEAKCREERGYEIILSGGDVEYRVNLNMSQKDHETLSNDIPEDFGESEHDAMCSLVRNDIARFIAKEFNTKNESEKIVLELENYVFSWEDNLRTLARGRRLRRSKAITQKDLFKA